MRRIAGALFILVTIAMAIFALQMRVEHPTLNETQLFLNYWYVWLSATVLLAMLLIAWRGR